MTTPMPRDLARKQPANVIEGEWAETRSVRPFGWFALFVLGVLLAAGLLAIVQQAS